jgi:NRPS condensation-like uncharacterized protein
MIPAQIVEPVLYGTNIGQLVVTVDLSRQWTAAEMTAAVRGLVRAYPILGCKYVPRFWRDRWEPVPDFPIERIVSVRAARDLESETRALASEKIDTGREWPLRVRLLTHAGGSRLIVVMPHLVADGNGMLVAVRELAAQMMGGGAGGSVPMNRSFGQIVRALRVRELPTLAGELVRQMRRNLSVPFLPKWTNGFHPLPAAERDGLDNVERITLEGASATTFTANCRRHGATVNDGLLAAAAKATLPLAGRGTGIAYTVNLRRFLTDPGPIVANLSGVGSVHVDHAMAQDSGELLRNVARQTGEQKARLPGLAFGLLQLILFGWLTHGFLHLFGKFAFEKGMLLQATRTPLMTNVGVLDPYLEPFGDLARDGWMSGPFYIGFPAPGAMVTTFRGNISVCLSACDHIPAEEVRGYAELWREALGSLCEEPKVMAWRPHAVSSVSTPLVGSGRNTFLAETTA